MGKTEEEKQAEYNASYMVMEVGKYKLVGSAAEDDKSKSLIVKRTYDTGKNYENQYEYYAKLASALGYNCTKYDNDADNQKALANMFLNSGIVTTTYDESGVSTIANDSYSYTKILDTLTKNYKKDEASRKEALDSTLSLMGTDVSTIAELGKTWVNKYGTGNYAENSQEDKFITKSVKKVNELTAPPSWYTDPKTKDGSSVKSKADTKDWQQYTMKQNTALNKLENSDTAQYGSRTWKARGNGGAKIERAKNGDEPVSYVDIWNRMSNVAGLAEGLQTPIGDVRHTDGVMSTDPAAITVSKIRTDWKTRLGKIMQFQPDGSTPDSTMTLRDLGAHITDTITSAISRVGANSYNVNEFDGVLLGNPFDDNLNDLYNIDAGVDKFKEYISKQTNKLVSEMEDNDTYMNARRGILRKLDSIDGANAPTLKMGDAGVLNPPFQFNELDDVRSDYRRPHIGRLYSERIYDYNMPVMFLQPGSIKINEAMIKYLLSLNDLSGDGSAKTFKADFQSGKLFKDWMSNAADTAVDVGTKFLDVMGGGFAWLVGHGSKFILDMHKWYHWVPRALLYMRYVNNILIELANWLGLIDYDGKKWGDPKLNDKNADTMQKVAAAAAAENQKNGGDAKNFAQTITSMLQAIENSNEWEKINAAIDNFTMGGSMSTEEMTKELDDSELVRYLENPVEENMVIEKSETDDGTPTNTFGFTATRGYMGDTQNHLLSVATILPQYAQLHLNKNASKSWSVISRGSAGINTPTSDGLHLNSLGFAEMTVPYMINAQSSVNESFNNNVTTHPLKQQYDQIFEEANSDLTQANKYNKANTIGNFVWNTMTLGAGTVKQWLQNIGAGMGFTVDSGMLVGSNTRFQLPQVWTDSSFERSYSVSMKFRSIYGHPLGVYENCFVPYIFLMPLIMPRKIMMMKYGNPFYVKAFCKGLFSIDMGMITNLSVQRGEDKNTRTVDGYHRTMTVSMTIQDMLPNLSTSVDAGVLHLSKAGNEGFYNYLLDLAGIDFIQRSNLAVLMKHEANYLHMKYNPFALATEARVITGHMPIVKIIGKAVSNLQRADPYKEHVPDQF